MDPEHANSDSGSAMFHRTSFGNDKDSSTHIQPATPRKLSPTGEYVNRPEYKGEAPTMSRPDPRFTSTPSGSSEWHLRGSKVVD